MAGTTYKKRSRDDAPKSKTARPSKKQRKQHAYHSASEDEPADDAQDFQAVNLLDSDEEDIHNAQVDDGSFSGSDGSGSDSEAEDSAPPQKKKKGAAPSIARKNKPAKDTPPSDDEADSDNGEEDENDEYSDLDDEASSGDEHDAEDGTARPKRNVKSKRNDPDAFANSMSKILAAKVSTKNRADPVLARDPSALEAGRQAVDSRLENKAKKMLREKKRLAMEKGRVRDVLVATNGMFSNINPVTGEVMKDTDGETTGQILETEKRLRKVAQRGVVQLFNAFRTAQVKAVEAEKAAKKDGILGVDRKKDKVTEMSKKGFLDLIASGGGSMKKGPMEEA
ncbi:Ribosomal RNA-processing protein 15 [Cytospora mali]|uniref:Ribosomal RNA-processing protein 15 n=1 Tax=Cytospora mali TaxID=578113 RepID=A0A194UT07_CYTMA|nr:Ribosomal RNA-processing protein 15 [Valsa mali var. pyri (nom. inval.)]